MYFIKWGEGGVVCLDGSFKGMRENTGYGNSKI